MYACNAGDQCSLEPTREHGVEKHIVNVSTGHQQEYFCPRGIVVHDSPMDCGRQCRNVEPDASNCMRDVEVLRLVLETKKTTVKMGKLYDC